MSTILVNNQKVACRIEKVRPEIIEVPLPHGLTAWQPSHVSSTIQIVLEQPDVPSYGETKFIVEHDGEAKLFHATSMKLNIWEGGFVNDTV